MSSAAGALRVALRPSVTSDPRELVEVLGGPAALARRLSGIPARGRLPRPGTAARRRYNANIRQAQRYTTTGGQRRGQGGGRVSSAARDKAIARWRKAAGPGWRSSFYRRLRARGARTRLAGRFKDSQRSRQRILPGGGPGVALSGGAIGAVLDYAEAGEWGTAAELYLALFGEAYGFVPDPDDDDAVDWIHVWVEGDAERG